MRTLILWIIILTATCKTYAQQEILKSNLEEYGTNMKYLRTWTDDKYLVTLTKGTLTKGIGYIFLLIHPERGIISSHKVGGDSFQSCRLFSADDNNITVFYRKTEKGKNAYYAVSFSKETGAVETSKVVEDLGDINEEAIFTFLHEGKLLFASATKDKTKFAFRRLSKTGEASIEYSFDLPDTLRRLLNVTNPFFEQYRKDYDRKIYVSQKSIRMIVTQEFGRRLKIHTINFDLTDQKIIGKTFATDEVYKSFDASFTENHIFVLKAKKTTSSASLFLDILKYPSFEVEKSYSFNKSTSEIPFQTSPLNELIFKPAFFGDGDFKFEDHTKDATPTQTALRSINTGLCFIYTNQTSDGRYIFEIGSRYDLLITNRVISTIYRFYGCLDGNFEPCPKPVTEKKETEKFLKNLKNLEDLNPEYTVFGYDRLFMAYYLKKSKEIVIQGF